MASGPLHISRGLRFIVASAFFFSLMSLFVSEPVVHGLSGRSIPARATVCFRARPDAVMSGRSDTGEPAGRAMAVGYVQIVFAALWGAVFFAESPVTLSLLGSLLIVGGTLWVSRSDT